MTTRTPGSAATIAGALVTLVLAGAVHSDRARAADDEPLVLAQQEIDPDRLLDVSIRIFDPGLPEEDEDALEQQGIYADLRKAEARYIPFHLKNVLEASGNWGAVRVVPRQVETADLLVDGELLESNGKTLAVHIRATDSKGRVWCERRYKQGADPMQYREDRLEQRDPYEDLYERVANDLLESQRRLDDDETRELREITRLQFASALVPAAFEDHLDESRKGRTVIESLPAADDPMVERLDRIRERDEGFIDALNEYYADFCARMHPSYDSWRGISYEEQLQLQAIRREARMQKILGGLLLLGGAVADGGSTASRAARDAAVISGALVLSAGIEKGKGAKIHREALRELAGSFDADIAPVLVEVEGQTLRLTGSAESQFAEWRRLLAEIFAVETGRPVDPRTGEWADETPADGH